MAKIRALECIPLGIPFDVHEKASGFAGADWSKVYMLLVRAESDDGIVGWGEAFGFHSWRATKAAFDDMVAPLAIGRDDSDLPALAQQLQQAIHTFGRYGITLFALSGLDIALHDVAAKRAGKPLRDLLGPQRRSRLPGYASLFKYGDPDAAAAACKRWVGSGARQIKLHENTIAAVAAAREACGDSIPIMLDVNCCWDEKEALSMSNKLSGFDLLWLEEPVFPPEDFASLARLRSEGPLPIAAGENACTAYQFGQMLDAGAVDYAQPSVTKVGGIAEFARVQELARKSNVPIAPHSPYFGPGLLATMHIIAAMDEDIPVEYFCLNLEANPFGKAASMTDGGFDLPTGPGIGIEPDADVIREYRIK